MKGNRLLVGLALLVALGITPESSFGGHKALSALLPGNPLEGSRLFIQKGCLRCHAVQKVGGVTGPDLGRGVLNRPLLEIAGVMWNHLPGMEHVFQEERVTRPTFEPSEMASIIVFLYYLSSLDPPGDAAVGSRLFRQKGCQTCHALGGRGGSVGPPLDRYSQYASPLFLTTDLWKKGKAMAATMRAMGVPRPTFEGNDIPDLLAYIRDVGGGIERVYAPPGSPQRGEALYRKKRCVECHSIRGHGAKVGPDLGITVKGSLMRIAGSLWNHGPEMWAAMAKRGIEVPSLDTKDMSDLVSYLYFFQFIDPPADVKSGRAVYTEKQCGTCHGTPGIVEAVAPDLSKVEELGTPIDVITQMWNHASSMEEMMQEQDVAWPVLKGGEMADLIAYLFSVRGGPGRPAAPRGSDPVRATPRIKQ
jgi:cytochrome c2